MHTDARTLRPGQLLQADLCIVGAGAAGISMALEWVGSSRSVLLLEGGGFDFEPRMQELYRGENVGLPYFPMEAARLHYFGGTTGHWAGFCSTLDAQDCTVRDWVPHSGWPITRVDLDPFYARAHTLLELGPYDYDAESWRRRDPRMVPFPLDPAVAWTKMWQFSRPTRFGTHYRDAIVRAPSVHLFTYANVCAIETNDALTAVTGLRVRTIDGTELHARATRYVLACSSIQNARLLLASGFGRKNDLIGRFFMEHLEMPTGNLALTGRTPASTHMYDIEFGKTKARGELALSAAAQRQHAILNSTVSLAPGALDEEGHSTFQDFPPDSMTSFRSAERRDTSGAPASAASGNPAQPRFFHLLTRQEQAPNPDSRVTLSHERDALGVPRARLDWRLTDLDRRSFRAFYETLGRALGRAGIARLQMRDWIMDAGPDWPTSLGGGWHHMGTTRMSDDPRQGVVDADCRVHGCDNLLVAGASVFPTAGAANPTLTLVALTLRLSDFLKTQFV